MSFICSAWEGTVNRASHRSPRRSSCACCHSQNAIAIWLYYNVQQPFLPSFSATAFSPSLLFPHKHYGRAQGNKVQCVIATFPSAQNDNTTPGWRNCVAGTHFMISWAVILCRYLAKHDSKSPSPVAEHDEPEAVYGSRPYRRIAYPDNSEIF